MTYIKKTTFIFSVCMLIVLAVFSCGLLLLAKPIVYASDISFPKTADDGPVVAVENNITITAFCEELNAGQGGIFTEGTRGGYLGKTETTCDNRNIIVDTNSQSIFYARPNAGYYLEGVYSNNEFIGDSLDISQNDDFYSITYNNEASTKFYAKFCLKRLNVILENGADFTLGGSGTYVYGATIQLKCLENSKNYKFSRWVKVVGEETSSFSDIASYRFEVKENIRLRAEAKILLETKECLSGRIGILESNVETTERYFEKGTNLVIKAIPDLGYSFVDYDLGAFINNPQQFNYTVDSPLSFGAHFESKKVTVSIETNNLDQSNLKGSTETKDRQFVIGDEIQLVVGLTKLFGLDCWETDASGEIDTKLTQQSYIITPQDAERGTITFLAKIKKVLASCEIAVQGKGFLFVNDTSTKDSIKEDKPLLSSYLITAQVGKNYYLSKVLYNSLSTSEQGEDWLDKLEELSFSFDVTEDFKLTFIFSPLTWSQLKIEPQGLGTKNNPYLIGSPEELAYMEYGINHNIKAKTEDAVDYRKAYFKLINDINLDGRYWFLIGENNGAKFEGVLDLNYKFITNITLTIDDSYSSNYKYLFTAENFQSAKIIHDADKMWRTLGISSSVFFAVALVLVLVAYMTNNRTQVKKVVVLNDDKTTKK